MKCIFAFLLVILTLAISLSICVLVGLLLEHKPTIEDFTFILIVNLMWQYYIDLLKRENK